MIYLRSMRIEHVLEYAGIDWRAGLPLTSTKAATAWTLATVVRDDSALIEDSKFYKSIENECDDDGKKKSLFTMFTTLRHAIRQDDYQEALKGTNVQVKEAGKFNYRSQNHKIWELKFKNKDRIYFFSHQAGGQSDAKILIPLLFHHKKDKTTPKHILEHCEKVIKPFLDPSPEINFLKEKS